MRTRLYGKIIEFYQLFGEWGFWFSRLIKLDLQFTRHLAGFSPNKEIVADEQPLQGYYPLEVQAA